MKNKNKFLIKSEAKDTLTSGRKIKTIASALCTADEYICRILNGKQKCNKVTAIALMYLINNYQNLDDEIVKYFEEVKE